MVLPSGDPWWGLNSVTVRAQTRLFGVQPPARVARYAAPELDWLNEGVFISVEVCLSAVR